MLLSVKKKEKKNSFLHTQPDIKVVIVKLVIALRSEYKLISFRLLATLLIITKRF